MGDPVREIENLAQTLKRELPVPTTIASSHDDAGGALVTERVAVPPGWTLQSIDHEFMLAHPIRTKALATLNDAPSFIAFVNRYAIEGTTVYCSFNPQTFALAFSAVIDEHEKGAPGWRKHQGAYVPDFSAEWKVWKGCNTTVMEQALFAEFIEANELDFAALPGMPSSSDMTKMALDFKAKADLRISSRINLQGGGQALEFVDETDGETMERMKLFEKFVIGIPIFWRAPASPEDKVAAFPITARLRFRIAKPKVVFWYELVRPDLAHQRAAGELIADIKAGIGAVPLVMGSST